MFRSLIILCLVAVAATARAGEPVAIVEEASAAAPVKLFSYLAAGESVELPPGETVVIGYLESCVQETVVGGVVTIGRLRSKVVGGRRSERQLTCAAPVAMLSNQAAETGAALVMRRPAQSRRPQVSLKSTTPVIVPRRPASAVLLQRIDSPDPAITVPLTEGAADLAALGVSLVPGGTYQVRTDLASTFITIMRDARAGGEAILPRLLSF